MIFGDVCIDCKEDAARVIDFHSLANTTTIHQPMKRAIDDARNKDNLTY
jgi:hypothetical protein